MRTEPSTPFSSGTEHENFIYYFAFMQKAVVIGSMEGDAG